MWQILIGIAWINIGLLTSRILPNSSPRRLGRSLFWVGAPLQIFALAHKSNFAETPWLPALVVVGILGLGLGLALVALRGMRIASQLFVPSTAILQSVEMQDVETKDVEMQDVETKELGPSLKYYATDLSLLQFPFAPEWERSPEQKPGQGFEGSFILAAILGNTMFIGMAIIPPLVDPKYLGWVVIFAIIHYILGSYGIGVFLANYYGQAKGSKSIGQHLMHLMKVPAFWAFILGCLSQSIQFPTQINGILQIALWSGVPTVFLLLGLQLGKMNKIDQIRIAIFPALIRTLILPGLIGIGLLSINFAKDASFAIVLMTGMPTNSANLILAEEYKLDPQLAAGSIILSTLILPFTIPLWYVLFR